MLTSSSDVDIALEGRGSRILGKIPGSCDSRGLKGLRGLSGLLGDCGLLDLKEFCGLEDPLDREGPRREPRG